MGKVIDIRRVPPPGSPGAAIDPDGLTTDNVVDFYCLLEREAVKAVLNDVLTAIPQSTGTVGEIRRRLNELWDKGAS